MTSRIEVAPDAEHNAFASMLADLLRQNLEDKPHKARVFETMTGAVAIVAEDAEVALTLDFRGGRLTVHDGIRGVPDATVRAPGDVIMALSDVPLTRRFALPIPRDRAAVETLRTIGRALTSRELQIHGMMSNFGLMNKLTQVLSVNG